MFAQEATAGVVQSARHAHLPRRGSASESNFNLAFNPRHKASHNTIEIWLILPVVICLFQGLSHACLRITALQESAHGSLHQTQSAAKMLRSPQKWITWRNAKLIHELMGSSRSTRHRFRPKAWWPTLRMNESTNQCTSRCSNTE